MKNQFEVISATATKNKNYCVKLQSKESVSVTTAFGDALSERQTTYYVFMTSAPSIGFKAELDVDMFDVVCKEHTAKDNTVVSLKYLYPKKG
jgi:queuine/archaeosine tRNA-ribosyltransferase